MWTCLVSAPAFYSVHGAANAFQEAARIRGNGMYLLQSSLTAGLTLTQHSLQHAADEGTALMLEPVP